MTFQSRTIYKKNTVTLSEAEKAILKTIVVTNDNVKQKYFRTIKIDSSYYGEIKIKGQTEQKLLSEDKIKNIRILDKTSTNIGNVAIFLVSAGGVYLIVSLIELVSWASNYRN